MQADLANNFRKFMTVRDESGETSRLCMNLWDVGGGNNALHLAHLFMRNVSCVIFVYSINSTYSVDELNDWIEVA